MTIKPMLAHKASGKRYICPGYIQPKLNGLRAIWSPENKTLQSRDQKLWSFSVIQHIATTLFDLPFRFDGELYSHGKSLQQINSRVAVNRVDPHPDATSISFHIFDIALPATEYHDRLTMLRTFNFSNPNIHIVPTFFYSDIHTAEQAHKMFKSEGYEGSILRDPFAHYGFVENCGNKENRWTRILKRKDFLDLTATIIGFDRGEGQFSDTLGSLVLAYNNITFRAGSGLTIPQRNRIWQNKDLYINKPCVINYEMLSDSGIPLKPTIELVPSL
jgi:ATP-dependent DNA ligase